MKVNILLFGVMKELVGSPNLEIDLKENASVMDVKQYLTEKYPASSKLNSLMVAVNECYAEDTDLLTSADEIAIIPPVSGG